MKLHAPVCRTSTLSRHGSPTPLKPVSGAPSIASDSASLKASVSGLGHSHPVVTHTYTLEQASFPYVTLALNSGASSPDQMPVFHGACPVTGEVIIEQSKLRSIKDVMVTVEGRLFTPSGEVTSFLSHTLSLITPAIPQPAPRTSTLDGTHTLPFSFTFPSVGSNGSPLPTSWTSALSPNTKIDYIFSLRIKRKSRTARRVCGDDVLNVPIIFHPRVRAEKQPLVAWSTVGLQGDWPSDRSAWHLSTATIRGSQVGQRDAQLRTTLGLAAPLAYPVHSTLPFTITLADERNSAPDVLSAPIAISVDLRRAVRYVPTAIPHPVSVWCMGCGFALSRCICQKGACTASKRDQEWTWETVAVANCWQVPHSAPNVRVVRGEIDLSGPLEPSFSFGGLNVSYAVHVRFSAPGKEDEHFTFVEPVTLVSELSGSEMGSTRLSSLSTSTPSMTSSSAASSAYSPSIRSASPAPVSVPSQPAKPGSGLSKTSGLSYSPTPSSYVADLPPSYDCSQVQAGYGYGLSSKAPLPTPPPPHTAPSTSPQLLQRVAPPSPPLSRASSEERELQQPVVVHSRAPCFATRLGLRGEKRQEPETWMRFERSEDDALLA